MRTLNAIGVAIALTLWGSHAQAQSPGYSASGAAAEYTQSSSPGIQRSFGGGTAIGAGVAAVTAVSSIGKSASGVGLALLLPSLELQAFFKREHSIDFSVPITNIIVGSILAKGFFFNADVFYNPNIGKGIARFIVGPGIGFTAFSVQGVSGGTFRIPGQLGLELLTKGRGFGFKILARPWVEFGGASNSSASASGVGGGVLGALVFSGYSTN
jgi:hypothetical protein